MIKEVNGRKLLKVISILLISVIVLEIIPYGVADYALHNKNGIWERVIVRTYSYASIYPFSYGNFAPLISSIASAAALIHFLLILLTNRNMCKFPKRIVIYLLIAIVCSTITFIASLTLVAGIITGLLVIVFLLYVLVMKLNRKTA